MDPKHSFKKGTALFFTSITVKTLYSDILYNSKILYNINCICKIVPVYWCFKDA